MNKGLIFDIRKFSIHDGPGIRTTIFFKGCPLKCHWCHNPESQACHPESYVKTVSLGDRSYHIEEATGRWMTVGEVMTQVMQDQIFYDESRGGVTISGGEPLFQPGFLLGLLKELKNQGFHVAIDTSGYAEKEVFLKIMPYTDTFLYDLKLMDEQEHIKYTGVSNHKILENLKSLISEKQHVIIRIPVIPGITDTRENIHLIKSLLKNSPVHQLTSSPVEINLLPFHSTAGNKYKRMNRLYPIDSSLKVDDNNLNEMIALLENAGFVVNIGG